MELMHSCRKRVREVRAEEATLMRRTAAYQAGFALAVFVGPVLVSIAAFAAYTGAPILCVCLGTFK